MTILNTAVSGSTGLAANIYSSSGTSAITTIHLCNYSGSAVTANIYICPANAAPGSSNIIYSNVSINSHDTLIVQTEKFILSNGDAIKANCSASNSVTATVSSIGI